MHVTNRFRGYVTAVIVFLTIVATTQAQYGGGTGEPNDPYLIYTAEQINTIGTDSNDWDKHFKLMADIDLSSLKGTNFNIIGTVVCFLPYPFASYVIWSGTPFSGTLDGNRKKIYNFNYTGTGRAGLFGAVDSNDNSAMIRDLILVDPNVSTSGVDPWTGGTGPLVAYMGLGTISRCGVENANISGDTAVGGLVGRNGGTIINCYATGSISGNTEVGGLIGNNSGIIFSSYCSVSVFGNDQVGGLVGKHLAITNQKTISDCYCSGEVSGNTIVGGLVGKHIAPNNVLPDTPTILTCYSVASVSGSKNVGGLVGESLYDAITDASFWDIQTSALTSSDGGTGLTTVEMQTGNTFLEAGWDFVGESEKGTEDIWAICKGVADADTDFADFCILAEHWLAADGSFWCGQGCDLTNDGSVNWQDLMVFADNWLR